MDPSSPIAFSSADYSFLNNSTTDPYLQYPSSNYEMHSISASSPRLNFGTLGISTSVPYYPAYGAPLRASSPRPFSPVESISPPMLSASELSGDGLPPRSRSRDSSGTGSPASANGGSLVHRHSQRQHNSNAAVLGNRDRRRSRTKMEDYGSDDDLDAPVVNSSSEMVTQRRREEIRRQRIESEQRRRDELREGYRRLKDVLPVSNQKSSKVSLLDRATTHIKLLETQHQQMALKIAELEMETNRLRGVNETLMLSAAERRTSSAPVQSQTPF
ncbi:hypothetical protein BOTBODRAFT_145891 [Botryobasidium botryosum FD-172 SS1]|uniref:BHLH domain-containing protein n=1 Tax=Botryobasidium botryosum (strain FD-172 SS1) TaxID=930990 RepID=A0A067ME13_BOTB1|nr:hypothetical protein BOTBODRAFT_145891 [Botryobasidium botryosum FD-172 SS1]